MSEEENQENHELWLKAGKINANPSEGEDIVITGLSGCFPESDNVHEFRDNLANKADMVTNDFRRWEALHPEIPKRAGKIWNVEKFDAGFFGVHQHQSHAVDPLCRILMEKCFECILDAGINPKELEGTQTGIFVGACASESEKYWFYDNVESEAFAITGCHRSMLGSRVAYALKLQGPAFVMDTACSSSFFAFEHAYRAIREGRCERAIVAGANLCLHPYVTLQFSRLGVLSLDGACKCFDDAANGYTRSEAICAILLQKSQEAKRIYAHVVHSKVNADGYKEQGITYPSGDTQKNLIREVYQESELHPNEISYMEAHGTGTKVGDPEELKAIHDIFLQDRDRPLLIGSVKSNIGHTEPTSGLCSITKVILSMEGGKILPNMNYKIPRKGVKALIDGSLNVITENTSWPDNKGLVGINSFGFGGANCHTILKWHHKIKPKRKTPQSKLPLLICVSGRTEEAVKTITNDLKQQFCDLEYVRLFHEIFKYNIVDHNYRGYLLINPLEGNKILEGTKWLPDSVLPLVFCFGRIPQISFQEFLEIKQFRSSIEKINGVLLKYGMNFKEILENPKRNHLLINICYQIAICDILRDLDVSPTFYFSENKETNLVCAYLDGILTLEEIVNLAKDNFSKDLTFQNLKSRQKWIKTLPPEGLLLNFGVTSFVPSSKKHKLINILPENPKGNILEYFFQSLGNLYLFGIPLNLHILYPKIQFPVSRGTPIISPLIKWDHSRNWYVTKFCAQDIVKTGFIYMALGLKDEFWKFLSGHVADGRTLFPATGYLTIVWDVLSMITGKITSNMQIVFENVRFLQATNVPAKGTLFFTIMIQRGSGNFEVIESGMAIVTGRVRELLDEETLDDLPIPPKSLTRMSQKDVYTELKLRGYNYRGAFKGLSDVDVKCSSAKIEWTGNWVTFLDNMLQMQIIQQDTRSLYVPTGIKQIYIDALEHSRLGTENKDMSVYAYRDLNVIRCGRIEVRGVLANVINRKKCPDPVLEKYVFIPNEASLDLPVSLRVIMQVALENFTLSKLKIIEHIKDNPLEENILQFIRTSLDDLPLIEADLRINSLNPTKVEDFQTKRISIESKPIGSELDCYMVIVSNLEIDQIPKLEKSLRPNGFLLLRNSFMSLPGFTNFLCHETLSGPMVLYQRTKPPSQNVFIPYNESECLTKVKSAIGKKQGNIILYTDQIINGLVGFTNCLRKEPGANTFNPRCFLFDRNISSSPFNEPEVNLQFNKNMAINIFQDGIWGTYRHLLLEDSPLVQAHHAYVNVTTRGDLSSLAWIQGPISENDDHLVTVHYGAVNFRDVMTASGRVSIDAITNDRLEQECVQGFEYSGIDHLGRRVMGMLVSGALSSILVPDPNMMLPVPKNWSLEDAVTVPVVYGTVLYGFFIRAGGLREGQTILIHSGTGGVGQAAISIGLFFKCNIFVTVGSEEKKAYLLKKFPELNPENIGRSRDTTFENLVLYRTKNRGVDIVLNSLAEEKLQASLRCLADGGHFLEIGKFDLAMDNNLDCEFFQRNITFHGIMLDGLFKTSPPVKHYLMALLQKAIDLGAVEPLERTVFEKDQLEKAFRYMASGKHVGKVVIKVRNDPGIQTFSAVPKYFCGEEKSCLVIGGLGGFGLELCDWLILRGCKHLFITSRNGPKTGYQALRLQTWKSYGATIKILQEDLYSEESCIRVLSKLPNLDAVFNLAAVLHDGLLEKQTEIQLAEVLNSKATTTKHLDKFTRQFCPGLKYFVAFSSVSCGRGNIAQVNYGMANSIMEKIMEQRKLDGFPALVIQWGSIADVGLAAELINDDLNERPIGGTLPQRISNCLELLDTFMAQECTIVASMVVAEKRGGLYMSDNMVDTVVNIMGLRDLKTVSLHSTLPELGMDSMMAVEIKQTLEREYEVFLNAHDIRTLTFARLKELQGNKDVKDQEVVKEKKQENLKVMLKFVNDEECSKKTIVPLKSLRVNSTKGFFLPGVEGFASILENICNKLSFESIGLQFVYDNPPDTLQDMARLLIPSILPHLENGEPFNIIAYSFGCTVAIELATILEIEFGKKGQLILIDGAHEMMLQLTKQQNDTSTPVNFETSVLCNIFTIYMPIDIVDTYRAELLRLKDYEERVNFVQSKSPEAQYSKSYVKKICIAFYKRVKAVLDYQKTEYKLKSQIFLLKPTRQSVVDIGEDYGLSVHSASGIIEVKVFDADHYSILNNEDVIAEIDNLVVNSNIKLKGLNQKKTIEDVKSQVKIR